MEEYSWLYFIQIIYNRLMHKVINWILGELYCTVYPLTCVQVEDEAIEHVKLRELVHDDSISLQHPTSWSPSQHVGESSIITVCICSK